MCLLLERNPDVQIREFRGISRILSKTEIVLYHDMFLMLLQYAEGYLQRSLVMLPLTDDLSRRRILLLRTCRNFIPGDEKSVETKWTHQIGKTRARRSCNAAVALSFLRTRQNTHVPDRLAILANLCNYEIRLDKEKHFTHLGVCVLALALLNGDFSILYPEVYNTRGDTRGQWSTLTSWRHIC